MCTGAGFAEALPSARKVSASIKKCYPIKSEVQKGIPRNETDLRLEKISIIILLRGIYG